MKLLKQKIEEAAEGYYPKLEDRWVNMAFKAGAQFLLDEGYQFTAEDMAVFADWYSMNWDLDFKPDAALKQWLEERSKNNYKSK